MTDKLSSTESSAKNPPTAGQQSPPSPTLFFDTVTAYQKAAAIKAGIELDVFTPLAAAPATADTVAVHCKASPRGIRILCDYLTVLGFLTKSGQHYSLTPDSAVFLNRKSPAYAGGTLEFLHSADLRGYFDQLTTATRNGGNTKQNENTVAPNHQIWISFAHSMGPMMVPAANALAGIIPVDQDHPTKVLDVSASHAMWGIAFARQNPKSHVFGLDWAAVLDVGRENARALGVADRYHTIAGSAFDVPFGDDYDVILLPNFLHHFSAADCVRILKKAHASLRSGGAVAIVEFVPNPDRITPPMAAGFSVVMLATTAEGDAYTFAEYSDMLAKSGFNSPAAHQLPSSMNTAIIARK